MASPLDIFSLADLRPTANTGRGSRFYGTDYGQDNSGIRIGNDLSLAIDKVNPDTRKGRKRHQKLLDYVLQRIRLSEDEMVNFYERWRSNEAKAQAYVHLRGREKILRDQNEENLIPNAVKMIVPYGYAALSTIVTFLLHTYTSRRPIFEVASYKGEASDPSRNMETLLQYQCDYMRITAQFWRFFNDIGTYGVGFLRPEWTVIEKMRTRRTRAGSDRFGLGLEQISRGPEIVYEGNIVTSLDPFNTFPDPRVSMVDCAEDGEFFFWRTSTSKVHLKRSGNYKYLDKIPNKPDPEKYNKSLRNWYKAKGADTQETAFSRSGAATRVSSDLYDDFCLIDQGTCWIIPREFGLGPSERAELYWFTIANKAQIIELEPFDHDYERHPVAASEPYGFGYGFGQPGPMDFVAPIQDMLSWLFNSHIENVRASLNSMWVVDPSRIVISDLKQPGPGKMIRLRQSALMSDVRTALHQFPVADVTRGHLADADLMIGLGQMLLAINENIMGQNADGGRKTAQEVRITGQAAMSRLSMIARVISSQAVSPMTEMMTLNCLQFLSDDFYFKVTGEDGIKPGAHIRGPDLNADYTFPVHDGTLPMDKFGMLQTWKEIFLGIAQNEALAGRFDVLGIFEHIAELAGASNIEKFRLDRRGAQRGPDMNAMLLPDQQVQQQLQAGNIVPFNGGQ